MSRAQAIEEAAKALLHSDDSRTPKRDLSLWVKLERAIYGLHPPDPPCPECARLSLDNAGWEATAAHLRQDIARLQAIINGCPEPHVNRIGTSYHQNATYFADNTYGEYHRYRIAPAQTKGEGK